jgi:protein-disulfide isomerase
MHDLLMTNQKKLEDDDLDGYAKQLELNMSEFATCKVNDSQVVEIMADMAEAQAAGVSGTPAFFVNGVLLSGAQPYEAFKAVIDAELADQAG